MRATWLTLGLILATANGAGADSVVVMAGPEHAAAMQVVLAGRGTVVASLPAPWGQMRLERAAAAQRAAAQSGADAAVWIEEGDICAVTSDGHDFRHAPFPVEAASPRAFAAIAMSLLDEMIAPAPWTTNLNVNVNVSFPDGGTGAPRVAFAGPPGTAAPEVFAGAGPRKRKNAGRYMVEIGPMLSPLTVGVEGSFLLPMSQTWQLGFTGAVNQSFDGNYVIGVAGAEMRRLGAGLERHWDVGLIGGYAAPDGDDAVVYGGARIARTWELSKSALSLGLSPILFASTSGNNPPLMPGVWSSLRWQFAL